MDLKLDGLAKEATLDAEKVNHGVWIHLDSPQIDPETGKPLKMYLDGDATKPQRALVRSWRCQLVRSEEDRRKKAGLVKARTAKKGEREEALGEAMTLPEHIRFGLTLAALDNFSKAGGVQPVAPADGQQIFAMSELDHIVRQISETSFDDRNYLADAETEAGNGSPAPRKTKGSTTER